MQHSCTTGTALTQLALSSYWMGGRNHRPLDFFTAGTDLGFDCFELSGIHHDTFYDEIRPGDFCIISLHDPAPPARGHARVGSKELRRADIVYTSLDDARRCQAIMLTKHSIDIAAQYGAQVVVLHLGQTRPISDVEIQLKHLAVAGHIDNTEAITLRSQLATERAYQHDEHMNALRRSLDELVKYASAQHIRLGLENRPAHEIAGFVEMGEILSWYPDDTVGYWHDTGHAEVQAILGFTPHADWLLAYGHRIIGMHLHDAMGIENHQAPGQGSVDWTGLASLVPANALRVMEVDRTVSADALRAGVGLLRETGWLDRLVPIEPAREKDKRPSGLDKDGTTTSSGKKN